MSNGIDRNGLEEKYIEEDTLLAQERLVALDSLLVIRCALVPPYFHPYQPFAIYFQSTNILRCRLATWNKT